MARLIEMLPPYNATASCTKCGGKEIGTWYCAKDTWVQSDGERRCSRGSGDPAWTAEHEHLHRSCARCRYGWVEGIITPGAEEVQHEQPDDNL